MKNKSLLIHLKSKYLSFKDLAPTVEVGKNMTDFYGNEIKLNSFFLDFYNHGIYASILNENKIRQEYIYDYLKDIKQILSYLKMIEQKIADLPSAALPPAKRDNIEENASKAKNIRKNKKVNTK